ncbi:MAG: hypothetical protein ACAI43_21245 [Phycisphaerae bacterium]
MSSSTPKSRAVRSYNQRAACVEGLEARQMLTGDVKWGLPLAAATDAIASDYQGNTYIVGRFSGTVDFNPGRKVYEMTAQSPTGDMFVVKFGNKGEFLWGVRFGDAAGAPVAADATVARTTQFRPLSGYDNKFPLDTTGSILWIAGTFSGSLDFDPHPRRTGTVKATGGTDIFLLGLDQNGIMRAAANVQSVFDETAVGVAVAPTQSGFAGYISVVGNQEDGSGDTQTVYAQYTAKGKIDGVNVLGSGGVDLVTTGVASDRDGNRYIIGNTSGPFVFSLIAAQGVISQAAAFVAKFDDFGSFQWVAEIPNATINDIAADNESKNIPNGFAIVGSFSGSPNVQFNPLKKNGFIHAAGGLDGFVARYDFEGSLQYAYRMGGTADDSANAVTMDGAGSVYVGGQFQGTSTFGRGPTLTSAGGLDAFAARYGRTGRAQYVTQFGGAGDDRITDVALGQGADLIVTGPLIAPGVYGRRTFTPSTAEDLFLLRLD